MAESIENDNDKDDDMEASAIPLIEHLAELRNRLIFSIAALVVGILAAFPFAEPILDFLFAPIAQILQANGQEAQLIFTAPQEKFFVLFRVAILTGLGLSFPVISFQMWRFVAPGLYKKEQQAFLPFLIGSPALFIAGGEFCPFCRDPAGDEFFHRVQRCSAEN